MAEFMEVMKWATRICKEHERRCNDCPFYNKKCYASITPRRTLEEYAEVERIAMASAIEHMEMVYPRWIDAWMQLFPLADGAPCPREAFNVKVNCNDRASCNECLKQPMDAGVARKLGIKPIKGRSEDA